MTGLRTVPSLSLGCLHECTHSPKALMMTHSATRPLMMYRLANRTNTGSSSDIRCPWPSPVSDSSFNMLIGRQEQAKYHMCQNMRPDHYQCGGRKCSALSFPFATSLFLLSMNSRGIT